MLIGWYFRNHHQVAPIAERLITVSIYVLLFTLGLKAGADKRITSELPTLGLTALLISVFAIAGSILVTWVYARFFLKKENK